MTAGTTQSTQEFFAECIAICKRGFDNEHAWLAWLRVRQERIDALPPHLRKQIMAAHENSGPKGL